MAEEILEIRAEDIIPLAPGEFQWDVCSAGYEWRRRAWGSPSPYSKKGGGTGYVLFPKDPDRIEQRNPLLTPQLFRLFAEVPLEREGIRSFADQHGLVGDSVQILSGGVSEPEPAMSDSEQFSGEAFDVWKYMIIEMRAGVGLWRAISTRDGIALRRCFGKLGELDKPTVGAIRSVVADRDGDRWNLVGRDDQGRARYVTGLWNMDPKAEAALEPWTAAKTMLVQLCNRLIQMHCRPFMYLRSARATAYTLGMVPTNLLGAVWMQFARTVVGESTIVKCRVCGKDIEHSTADTGSRSDKATCSNACKLKEHRRKVREARLMASEGQTPQQIAKHFDTSIKTIKNWLTKKK